MTAVVLDLNASELEQQEIVPSVFLTFMATRLAIISKPLA